MTIATILGGKGREVVSISPDASVADAVKLLHERGIGAVPVMRGSAVEGVFSERDVIRVLASEGGVALAKSVADAMSAPAITAAPDQPVLAALTVMTRQRVRHLPVVDGDTVVGIVSIGDLVKYRIDRIEADAAAMRDYIQSA